MSTSFKKLWNEYGVGVIIVLLILAYGVSSFANYLTSKGSYGREYNTNLTNSAYSNTPGGGGNSCNVSAANPAGQNEVFSQVNDIQTSMPGVPPSCNVQTIQSPDELLPKDSNSQWAQLNPSGQGELQNVNLLKAGYHIGIDSIGTSLRNANLQIRSEPPNPQIYVGPWNQSTIQPDFLRPPLEIGAGGQ
jgi:hypothetical protein